MWCNLRFLTTKAGPNALSTISKTASRKTIIVNGQTVKTFSPEWILREKILSQHEREGTLKEATDIRDVANMLWLVIPGKPELNFDHDQKLKDALGRLLQKGLLWSRVCDRRLNVQRCLEPGTSLSLFKVTVC